MTHSTGRQQLDLLRAYLRVLKAPAVGRRLVAATSIRHLHSVHTLPTFDLPDVQPVTVLLDWAAALEPLWTITVHRCGEATVTGQLGGVPVAVQATIDVDQDRLSWTEFGIATPSLDDLAALADETAARGNRDYASAGTRVTL